MITETAIAKAIGVASGTILALVFVPPHSVRDSIRRGAAALIFGAIFEGAVRRYLEWPPDFESIMMSSTIAAGCSWWIMGAGVKLVSDRLAARKGTGS